MNNQKVKSKTFNRTAISCIVTDGAQPEALDSKYAAVYIGQALKSCRILLKSW